MSRSKDPSPARLQGFLARADRTARVRQAQKADAPAAVRDYRTAQQTQLDNMARLRALREARGQRQSGG